MNPVSLLPHLVLPNVEVCRVLRIFWRILSNRPRLFLEVKEELCDVTEDVALVQCSV